MAQENAHVLIVDDEPFVRDILKRWLTEEGYRCDTAESGEEALIKLQTQPFELLISDIMMPGMSGLELLREVKASFPHVAVVMITAVDDRETAVATLKLGAYAYIIKPFDHNEVLINVVNALERRRLALVSEEYERQLEAEVRERTAELRRREEEIALRLVSATEYRDVETGGHVRRMGLYSEALAKTLGWEPPQVETMRLAAPMHDIGKIGVPDQILLKPGKLTDEEFETMKQHTSVGASILEGSDVELINMARDIALCHHERWDGNGYPQGLRGEEIPKSARLVAVADVYDALVSDRVYRPAMPEDQALDILTKGRGVHFDPEVLDGFLHILPTIHEIRDRVAGEDRAAAAAQTKESASEPSS